MHIYTFTYIYIYIYVGSVWTTARGGSYRIIKFALANKIFLSRVSKVKMEKSKHAPNTTKFELDQPSRALLKDFGDHQEHETRYTISVSDSLFREFATNTQLANILCFADMGWLEQEKQNLNNRPPTTPHPAPPFALHTPNPSTTCLPHPLPHISSPHPSATHQPPSTLSPPFPTSPPSPPSPPPSPTPARPDAHLLHPAT